MLAKRAIYRSETRRHDVDPHHDPVPMIGTSRRSDPAHAMLELVLPVAGTSWLDERLGEADAWQPDCPRPILLCLNLVVSLVEVHGQNEFCVGIEIQTHPSHEGSERSSVGIAELDVTPCLGAFAPVEDDTTDEL